MATYDNKPLDGNGLSHLWAKIKATFAAKSDIPAAGSTTPVMDGTGATGTSAAYARADHVHPTDTSRAPISHASTATTYGKGTSSNYGHVKLSDATNSTTAAASGGTAATPKAVSDALTAAKAYADSKADQDTTYTLSGSLSSHKVTSTLTPSSGTATTSDFTLAAGTGITITDDATNRKMTIATTAEANQNAFSNVKVGSTTIAADAKQDTLTLAAGSNVTLTPDATNDKVTIAATDTNTTYLLGTTGSGTSRKVTLTPSDGTTQSVDVPDTTYSDFEGATPDAAGTHGLVPRPMVDDFYRVLSGDGGWEPLETLLMSILDNPSDVPGFLYLDWETDHGTLSLGPDATTSAHGLMSTADKTKLNGIATGAEVNQNAFSNVKVGSTTVAADAKTDTLELVAGSNVTLTPDATNDKVTIAATDTNTTYGLSISGHTVSLVEGGTTTSVTVPDNDTTALGSMTGTLGVAHGGTGVSTLGAGVVYHSASGTGALSIASAANIVSAIGNSAVNRATADASGNNIADTYAKKSEITGVYKYKGSVSAEADLPSSPSTGDVYNIESASTYGAAGANVAWNGTAWDSLGEVFALDPLTNSEIDAICV